MAKQDFKEKRDEQMSADEARKYRAALYKPEQKKLSLREKREAFRVWWAQEKSKYGMSKDLEEVLWLHLEAVKMNEPDKFENGVNHFGLKKVE